MATPTISMCLCGREATEKIVLITNKGNVKQDQLPKPFFCANCGYEWGMRNARSRRPSYYRREHRYTDGSFK